VRSSRISFRDPDKWKYPGETWHPGFTKKINGQTQPRTKQWGEIVGRNKSARDPHEVFYKQCFIAFESDEMITLRL